MIYMNIIFEIVEKMHLERYELIKFIQIMINFIIYKWKQ